MARCPECGGHVEDPTLWLAQPTLTGGNLAYCSPTCGSAADARTTWPASQLLRDTLHTTQPVAHSTP